MDCDKISNNEIADALALLLRRTIVAKLEVDLVALSQNPTPLVLHDICLNRIRQHRAWDAAIAHLFLVRFGFTSGMDESEPLIIVDTRKSCQTKKQKQQQQQGIAEFKERERKLRVGRQKECNRKRGKNEFRCYNKYRY